MDWIQRFPKWIIVPVIAILALLPGTAIVRTGLGEHVEHAAAYAGMAFCILVAYGSRLGVMKLTLGFILYAAVLELLQHYVPGRHPKIGDFLASSTGVCIGLVLALIVRSLWRTKFAANSRATGAVKPTRQTSV